MCIRIVARPMKTLIEANACHEYRGSETALANAIGKCEKPDGTTAYIFDTLDECTRAKTDFRG